MKGITARCWVVLVSAFLGIVGSAQASLLPAPHPVSVVMLSDLHFDPYRDPAKVSALRGAPTMQWEKILSDPMSVTQTQDYRSLQTACHARGVDSSWDVVGSSLRAAHTQDPQPLFVTVSGDLLVHNFECRMKTLDPTATEADVSAFATKTIEFLALTLRQAFPGTPIYLALGNNDSGCGNYHQSPGSAFVKATDADIAAEFTKPRDEKQVLPAFSSRGDYSVLLPKSMHRTRLVVLEDVYQSPAYADCDGNSGEKAGASQMDWLREQLIAAKKEHQMVWVMAHIPPGIDTYASFQKFVPTPEKLCAVTSPTMMMRSDALAQMLTEYADTVKLAIFAHTHMDEIKLLHNAEGLSVPAKLVPSISPVNGNVPSFVVAKVQPSTAVMLDYTVYSASDLQATSWSEAYRFANAYRMPDFSADSVAQVASRMAKDKAGDDEMSATYQRWFFPGDDGAFARRLKAVWPGYACAVKEDGGPLFQECMCAGTAGNKDVQAVH